MTITIEARAAGNDVVFALWQASRLFGTREHVIGRLDAAVVHSLGAQEIGQRVVEMFGSAAAAAYHVVQLPTGTVEAEKVRDARHFFSVLNVRRPDKFRAIGRMVLEGETMETVAVSADDKRAQMIGQSIARAHSVTLSVPEHLFA